MDFDNRELDRLEKLDRGAIDAYEAVNEKIDQCVFSALAGGKTLKEAREIADEFLGERKRYAWEGVQYWGNAVSKHKAKMTEVHRTLTPSIWDAFAMTMLRPGKKPGEA